MTIEEFAERVLMLSPRIMKGLAHYEHDHLTRGEITLPQFLALGYLYSEGKSKMSALSKELNISPAATTGLIDRLIAQDLVTRKDDPQDRRIVWIEITSKGKDIVGGIRKQKIKTIIRIFGKISLKDRSHYLDILKQVVKIVDSISGIED